jgi:hypothetical protein
MSDGQSTCLLCDRPAHKRGYCSPHYQRLLRLGDPLAGGTHRGAPLSFIERLLTEKHTDCVIWPFATSRGYAYVKWNGKRVRVSRLLCRLVHGDPPNSAMEAAHRCGNGARGCVNPSCLYWATKTENEADKLRHGTLRFGEKHVYSKLTDSQADDIRRDARPGKVIAADYGIDPSHVSKIKSGKRRISYAARLKAAEERMKA